MSQSEELLPLIKTNSCQKKSQQIPKSFKNFVSCTSKTNGFEFDRQPQTNDVIERGKSNTYNECKRKN